MRCSLAVRVFLVVIAFFCGWESVRAQVAGEWRGGVRYASEWHAARIMIVQQDSKLTGQADVFPLGIRAAPVQGLIEGSKVTFKIGAPPLDAIILNGSIEDGALRSASDKGWDPPGFQFLKVLAMTPELYGDYTGWYEKQAGSTMLVTRGAEHGLRFFQSGRVSGTLLPVEKDCFAVAYMDQVPTTLKQEGRFERDERGNIIRLVVGSGNDTTVFQKLHSYRYEQQWIEFQNRGIRLRGLLLAPNTPAKSPAVVFIQGTGYSTTDRPYELSLVETFLAKGIAVLLFDKRGCGGSTGDWRTASLDDLAGDVVAGVRMLGARKEFASGKIGVYGISEGGWVAPIAANKSRKVAFVINQGGPAVPPLEDELDDLTAGVKRFGLPAEDLNVALNLARAWVELYRSHAGLAQYQAAIEAVRNKPWFPAVQRRLPKSENDWEVQWWRKRGQLQPSPLWKKLRVPALVLIGEQDNTMDVRKNVALFGEFRAVNSRIEIRVIPGADHGLRIGGKLVPDYPTEAAEWILRVLRAARP